jgi:fructokinase
MPEAIALGELLIDFVPTLSGVSLIEAPAFQKAPGGAPANVAVGLARLGVSSGFMGKVGDDAFGHFLAQTLEQAGVDISALCYAGEARTALAFVSLMADGERDFMFYRHPSADMLYRPEELKVGYIQSAKIFHYGSISLISEPSRSTTLKAIEIAQSAGLLVSYDPNLRLNLWPGAREARQGILDAWTMAQVIKISEEELKFLSGKDSIVEGARSLWHDRLKLLVITRGKAGCTYFTPNLNGNVPGYPVAPVDTTGAGDGFVAGLLKGLIESLDRQLDELLLSDICRYANAVGALTTTQRGAIPALPTRQEVDDFIGRVEPKDA